MLVSFLVKQLLHNGSLDLDYFHDEQFLPAEAMG
jgi:hypothetical protein